LGHCSHLSTRHFKAEELIELCKVAGKYQKSSPPYPSKPNLLEAFDELLRTARESDLPAEVYHIKTAGQKNKPASQLWLGW
jgi:N-acyl-D-amino-acid deacylase